MIKLSRKGVIGIKEIGILKRRYFVFFLFSNILILAIAVFYNIISAHYSSFFACRFFEIFSFPCPGCGGTRALAALLRFNVVKSFLLYPPILISCFVIIHFDFNVLRFVFNKKQTAFKKIPVFEILLIPFSIIISYLVKLVCFFAFNFDIILFASSL